MYFILILASLILLFLTIRDFRRSSHFLKHGERCTGTITELIELKDDDGITYSPVFKINTLSNGELTHRSNWSSSSPKWQVGKTAEFIFTPGQPESLRLLNYWAIYKWTLILGMMAFDFLAFGLGYYLLHGYFGYGHFN